MTTKSTYTKATVCVTLDLRPGDYDRLVRLQHHLTDESHVAAVRDAIWLLEFLDLAVRAGYRLEAVRRDGSSERFVFPTVLPCHTQFGECTLPPPPSARTRH